MAKDLRLLPDSILWASRVVVTELATTGTWVQTNSQTIGCIYSECDSALWDLCWGSENNWLVRTWAEFKREIAAFAAVSVSCQLEIKPREMKNEHGEVSRIPPVRNKAERQIM